MNSDKLTEQYIDLTQVPLAINYCISIWIIIQDLL